MPGSGLARRNWAVALASVGLLLAGCGEQAITSGKPESRTSETLWDSTGIAYALPSRIEDPTFTLGFEGHQVEVTSPLDDAGYRVTRQLAMTSTSTAGVFLLGPVTGKHELWLLTKEGEWFPAAQDVAGMPAADLTSPWLFWITTEHQLTAYNTDAHKIVATIGSAARSGDRLG